MASATLKETTMSAPDIRSLLTEMHEWLARIEQRRPANATLSAPGSLELGALPADAPPAPCSLELDTPDSPTEARALHYHVGHFSARHKLSPAEAWTAEQLLRRANHLRPIRGKRVQQRQARRIAGIVSAVRNGRVSNPQWGHRMLAKRGGLAMAAHGAHVLARNREAIRLRRQALRAVKQRQPQTEFEQWQRSLESPAMQAFTISDTAPW
jgi:hypothetical protein